MDALESAVERLKLSADLALQQRRTLRAALVRARERMILQMEGMNFSTEEIANVLATDADFVMIDTVLDQTR